MTMVWYNGEDAIMTIYLTDDQQQAIERGEPVQVEALGLGEIVVVSAELYNEARQADAELAAWAEVSREAANKWAKENPY